MVNSKWWTGRVVFGAAQRAGDLRGLGAEKAFGSPARDRMSLVAEEKETQQLHKMDERCTNVVENKGPVLKTCAKSGNVIENTALISIIRECC
jgi:hypothetical protein